MIICKLHFEPCICLNVWTQCYLSNAINWIAYVASSKFVARNLNEIWHTFIKLILKAPGSSLVLAFIILQFSSVVNSTFPYYLQQRT